MNNNEEHLIVFGAIREWALKAEQLIDSKI
jgi:hypothetical protein